MGCSVSIDDTTLGASLIGHTFKTKRSTCLTFHKNKRYLGRTMYDVLYKKVDVGFFSLEIHDNLEFNIISIHHHGDQLDLVAEITSNVSLHSLGQLREFKHNGWSTNAYRHSTNMHLPLVSFYSIETRGLIVTINAETLGFILPRVNNKIVYNSCVTILTDELIQVL